MSDDRHVLECKNISYMTAIAQGNWFSRIYKPPSVFQILKNVSLTAHSSEIHAIVGVSDSGKTTLLESLANGAGGDIGGIAMLDKLMLTRRRFSKHCAHVNYRDSYPDCLSVRCLLYNQARLYLSSTLSKLEIDHKINELMAMFDLLGYCNEKLENLSRSAKKRLLTIIELLKDPILILIDDPTRDLSPLSAYQLMYALQFYAQKYNKIIILTMRNVRSDLYHLITSITILFYGEVAYSGPIRHMPMHFSKAGFECPITENPASYFLSFLTVDKESMEKVVETQKIARKLIEFWMENDSKNVNIESNRLISSGVLLDVTKQPANISVVFSILFKRLISISFSIPISTVSMIICLPIVAILLSIFSPSQYPVSSFFWKFSLIIFLVIQKISIIELFIINRLFNFLEISCYSNSLGILPFSVLFVVLSAFQAFLFVGISLWTSEFHNWILFSFIFWILSFFSFSIFSMFARYFKNPLHISISHFTVILIFYFSAISRFDLQFLNEFQKLNPFLYANSLISKSLQESETDCISQYPRLVCRIFDSHQLDNFLQSDFWTNLLFLSSISFTYFIISTFSHFIPPSIQLQNHIKYK